MFIKENVNPKKKTTDDCVIRAIAKAEGKDWLEIYDALSVIGRKYFTVQNSPDAYSKYLKNYQTIDVKYFNKEGIKKRYLVSDICNWKGTYVISIANHLTTVVDGDIYDLWDCGNRSAYKIWKIK